MLIGLLSDVHGDLGALEQALNAVKTADKIFFLGDVHEFTPTAGACIDLLKDHKVIAVRGNCDRYGVIGDQDGSYRAWLSQLPIEYREGDLVFVHVPKSESSFHSESFRICFCGHTHRSFVLTKEGQVRIVPNQPVVLAREKKYIVGIGSAAKPRGGESRVAALYDTGSGRLDLREL